MLSYTPKIPSFVLYIKSVYCNHITQTVCNGHNEQLTTTHHLIRSEYSTRFLYILLVSCIFYSFSVYSTRFLYTLLVSCIFYSFPVYSTRFLYILLVSCIFYSFPVYYTCFLYILLVSCIFYSFPVYSTRFLYIILVSCILYSFPVYYTRFLDFLAVENFSIFNFSTFGIVFFAFALVYPVTSSTSMKNDDYFQFSYLIIMHIYIFFNRTI